MNNILLSYPRSGNTWIRYALECVTGQPTSIEMVPDCQEGFNKLDSIGSTTNLNVDVLKKCIVIKRHRADHHWDSFTKENTNLILVVRSYKEAIIRHLITQNYKDKKVIDKNIDDYIHCLDFYDSFDGNKVLVYYEDLIINEKKEFERIFNFLNLNKDTYQPFFKNIKYHRVESIKNYQPGSVTQGAANKLTFHSNRFRRLSSIVDKKIRYSPMFNKYLKRFT